MKKMRRMIPALCMLLVSAIMLTTASYAWFTMNESVTASGMQIQAQATGSLVISDKPLQVGNANPSINFGTDVAQLSPIHLTEDGVWQKPAEESVIDPTLGTPDYRGMVNTTPASGINFIEKTIYIGTSGAAALEGGHLSLALSSVTSSAAEATKAYAVAVYVTGVVEATYNGEAYTVTKVNGVASNSETVSLTAEPFHILYVDSADTRSTEDVALANWTIPSIVGYGEGNDTRATGLQVVLRFYVDGALNAIDASGTELTREVAIGYTYTSVAGSTYEAETNYFVKNGYVAVTEEELRAAPAGKILTGWYTLNEGATEATDDTVTEATAGEAIEKDVTYYQINYVQGTAAMLEGSTTVPAGWYTREEVTDYYNYFYVNNKDVPSAGSNLSVKFEHIPAPEQGDDAGENT